MAVFLYLLVREGLSIVNDVASSWKESELTILRQNAVFSIDWLAQPVGGASGSAAKSKRGGLHPRLNSSLDLQHFGFRKYGDKLR